MIETPVSEALVDDTVSDVVDSGTTVRTCPSPAWSSFSLTARVIADEPVASPPVERMVSVFVPSEVMRLFTVCAEPLPTASSRMTAATPMSTPSMVRMDRSLLAVTPRRAESRMSPSLIGSAPDWRVPR